MVGYITRNAYTAFVLLKEQIRERHHVQKSTPKMYRFILHLSTVNQLFGRTVDMDYDHTL